MGPSWDRPFPHSLCLSSSLKYPDNAIWCTFPELFYRCGFSTKWKKLTTWWPWAWRPSSAEGFLTLTPVTLPCYLIHQSENCARAAYLPWDGEALLPPHFAFKNPLLKPIREHCTRLHHKPASTDWLYHPGQMDPGLVQPHTYLLLL